MSSVFKKHRLLFEVLEKERASSRNIVEIQMPQLSLFRVCLAMGAKEFRDLITKIFSARVRDVTFEMLFTRAAKESDGISQLCTLKNSLVFSHSFRMAGRLGVFMTPRPPRNTG
jgi:hypothetical protein